MTFDEQYEQLRAEGKIFGAIPKERIKMLTVPRIKKDILERLRKVDDITCELSDALDNLGYFSNMCTVPAAEIPPLETHYRAVGIAVTTRSCPEQTYKASERSTRKSKMLVRDLPFLAEGDEIWLVEAKGCNFSSFGEIAAKIQKEHGLVGTIVDGYIRDGESIKKTGYPFWVRGQNPFSGMKRLETIELNGPVTIGNIQVKPGDLVAADANGICAVPHAIIDEVFTYMKEKGIV